MLSGIHFPHVRLAEWWSATSSGIITGATDVASITALEKRYSIALPKEFRDYVALACPQNDSNFDNELTNWWPIAQIKNIPDEYESEIAFAPIKNGASKFLFFADYSIWCWAWAICCDESEHRGKVAVIGGGDHDRFVASSFGEFVDRYIADPMGPT